MKRQGTSIIFVNSREQVLLLLRDDIAGIPYPGCWDIPGGHVEEGETPEQCIVREMKEEIGLAITQVQLFNKYETSDKIEYTYWQKADLDVSTIILNEGQKLKWFTKEEIVAMPDKEIAFNFKPVILEFFGKATFK